MLQQLCLEQNITLHSLLRTSRQAITHAHFLEKLLAREREHQSKTSNNGENMQQMRSVCDFWHNPLTNKFWKGRYWHRTIDSDAVAAPIKWTIVIQELIQNLMKDNDCNPIFCLYNLITVDDAKASERERERAHRQRAG